MTGATLGNTALTAARAGAQDVIDVFAATVANNIAFFLVVAAVGVAVWVVRYIMKKMTRPHR
jgi:hypothetical protein